MADLDVRLRELDRQIAPNLWGDIRSRQPRPLPPVRTGRRFAIAVAALGVAAFGIFLAVRALSGDQAAPRPASTPPRGLILFTTQGPKDGQPWIALMNPNGGNVRRLAQGLYPTWSPDGTQIVFGCVDGKGRGGATRGICVMNADGSDRHMIDEAPRGTEDGEPDWSVSGIAFDRTYLDQTMYHQRPRDILVVDPDGSEPRVITPNGSDDFDPSWSPDGSRLAFIRVPGGRMEAAPVGNPAKINQVWIMNADGTDAHRGTGVPGGANRPAWSPDGARILFDSRESLWTVNTDGTGLHQVLAPAPPATDAFGAWSSDGSRIAFMSTRGGFDQNDVWLVNSDGTGLRRLTRTPTNDAEPRWRPTVAGSARGDARQPWPPSRRSAWAAQALVSFPNAGVVGQGVVRNTMRVAWCPIRA